MLEVFDLEIVGIELGLQAEAVLGEVVDFGVGDLGFAVEGGAAGLGAGEGGEELVVLGLEDLVREGFGAELVLQFLEVRRVGGFGAEEGGGHRGEDLGGWGEVHGGGGGEEAVWWGGVHW